MNHLIQATGAELVQASQSFVVLQGLSGVIEPPKTERDLLVFSADLRQHLDPGRMNTAPYWAMIDAISFWRDAHPGEWPYMTDARREQSLRWAQQDMSLALAA